MSTTSGDRFHRGNRNFVKQKKTEKKNKDDKNNNKKEQKKKQKQTKHPKGINKKNHLSATLHFEFGIMNLIPLPHFHICVCVWWGYF